MCKSRRGAVQPRPLKDPCSCCGRHEQRGSSAVLCFQRSSCRPSLCSAPYTYLIATLLYSILLLLLICSSINSCTTVCVLDFHLEIAPALFFDRISIGFGVGPHHATRAFRINRDILQQYSLESENTLA